MSANYLSFYETFFEIIHIKAVIKIQFFMKAIYYSIVICNILNDLFNYVADGRARFIEDIETDFVLKNATARRYLNIIRGHLKPIEVKIRYSKKKGGYYLTKPCRFKIELIITAELI
jgi:hypothetical protein